jgi:hypothetical protein
MNTSALKGRMAETSPHFNSGITGIFYLITVMTGAAVLLAQGSLGLVFDLIAAVFYIAVTALFYRLSRTRDSRSFTKSSQRS